MNEVIELENTIRSRHSVRAFRPEPVAKDLIERILATACYAPVSYTHLTLPTKA